MEKKAEKVWAEGIYFDKPREGAPEFVKGKISINVGVAKKFLDEYKNSAGYVNLDLKKSMEKGTLYLELNQWEPEKKVETKKANLDEF